MAKEVKNGEITQLEFDAELIRRPLSMKLYALCHCKGIVHTFCIWDCET